MYGKFDTIDLVVQIMIGSSALFSVCFGIYMLGDPFGWYEFVGTVKASGPANGHFIRDIGIAYAVSGLILGFAALNPNLRWGTALLGNLWLAAHGILHIYEVLAGVCSKDIFWQDAPGVLGPPALVLVAVAIQVGRQRISPVPLPKSIFVSLMRNLGEQGEPYIEDLAKAGGFVTEKFQHGLLLAGHRYHASAPLFHMACLGSIRFEDCGSCVEIIRQYAENDGVDPQRIQNALMGKPDNSEDALAYRFGAAIASGDMTQAAELGDIIETKYGRHIRTELTLGAASSRLFPAMKRGLGYASTCQIPQAQ